MADNFWDALEGKTSAAPASQEAPAFVPAPAAGPRRPAASEPAFKPSSSRVAEKAAGAASAAKQSMPEPAPKSPVQNFMDDVLGLWMIPASAIAGAVAYEAGRKTYKAVTSKTTPLPMSQTGTEPTFNQPVATNATSAPAPQAASTVMTAGGPVNLNEVPPEMRPMVERSAQVTQQKMAGTPVAPPAAAPVPVAPVAPSPMAAAPAGAPVAPAPLQIPSLTQTVEQGGDVTKAVQADVARQIEAGPAVAPSATPAPSAAPSAAPVAPPKERMKSTFKTAAEIPPGMVFREDVGNVDRALFNILGPEHRQNAKDLLNQGKPFGDAKDVNQRVSKITQEYWKAVQGQIPETILGREERVAQGVPHQGFGNFGGLGRAVKVGGVAGTLLTAAEAALAAQQGRYGEAAVRGADVASDFIPGLAAAKQAFTGTSVAPGTLPAGYVENAALLGSPYYGTEWAKSQRMREGAGAGRGFVNPPMAR